ncbi:hypothetical protein OIU78_014695 [Salix suchowensis]|nr:hypothetical protein OIU78_014695 [Salix suchowensis]
MRLASLRSPSLGHSFENNARITRAPSSTWKLPDLLRTSRGQRSIIWLQTAPDSSSIAPSLNQIPQQHSQKQELIGKIAGERGRHRGQGEWLESRRRFFLRSLFRIWSGSGCFDSAWLAGTSAGERRSLPFRRRSVIQLGRVSTAPQSKPTSYTERTNSGSARALLSSKKRTAPSRIGRDAGPESASSLLVEKYYSLVGEPFAREESARAAQR